MRVSGEAVIEPAADISRPSGGLAPAHLKLLTSVMADLGTLNAPAEEAFLAITAVLGDSSTILGEVRTSFEGLIGHLQSSGTTSNIEGLRQAAERIATLSVKSGGSNEVLVQLDGVVRQIEANLSSLSKVIAEVGGLAINAKIEAALIAAAGIDFTVFTSEIQRLRGLAQEAIGQTGGRLHSLRRVILDALSEEHTFERSAAAELAGVQERLRDGIAIIAQQHQAASAAVQRASLHSQDTAQRVVASMMELQFNDTACQRIQHVRDAMATIIELAQAGAEENISLLVGAVCRLQALQLSRTAADYQDRVEALIVHLREITNDALKICAEADAAVSNDKNSVGDKRGGSFIGTLEKDVSIGAQLLNREAAGQERVRAVIHSVSTGFTEMKRDIDSLHSIDADMRVMGLNATFKCTRLGPSGRALGVIAQELRSCSKRTEEISGQISRLLLTAIDISGTLGTSENNDAEMVSELGKWMMSSSLDLGSLSRTLEESLDKLRQDGERVAHLLSNTANKITVHRHMSAALLTAGQKLNGIADATGVQGADIDVVGERIRSLLANHYTMQSERLIHELFADHFDDETAEASAEAPATETDIDDLLF